jgi:hypothetical protein
MRSVKKELKIYRGTYDEIMSQPTEDMTIYLSWNTQEIFVGNAHGVKTPYIGGSKLTERQVKDIIAELGTVQFNTLRAQLTAISSNLASTAQISNSVNSRLSSFENNLNEVIADKITELFEGDSSLGELLTENEASALISSGINNYDQSIRIYVRNQFPTIIEESIEIPFKEDYIPIRNKVLINEAKLNQYSSIKILSEDPTTDQQLASNLANIENGIYSYKRTTDNGVTFKNEILNINKPNVIRLSSDGFSYIFNETTVQWTQLFADPEVSSIVRKINTSLTPDSTGNINITTDNIIQSQGKFFNSLIPQANNVVNPLGRNQSSEYGLGSGSISFGYNSAATASNSVSLGAQALATGSNSVSLGFQAVANANNSVQIGNGQNSSPNTLKFMNKEIINSQGKIPDSLIVDKFNSTELTIPSSEVSWGEGARQHNASVVGMTSSALVWVSPTESSFDEYSRAGVRAVSQGDGVLVFKCDEKPLTEIRVNVVWKVS